MRCSLLAILCLCVGAAASGVMAAPQVTASPQAALPQKPSPGKVLKLEPVKSGVYVRTPAFQITGTGSPVSAARPLSIRTAAFQLTGTGSLSSGASFPPRYIRSLPLTLTGNGRH
jgi:hypothetical protein